MKHIIIITISLIATLSLTARDFSQFKITGSPDQDRVIIYGGLGAAAGTVIGNQMGGDRSEKRAIGAAAGGILGVWQANRVNKREQEIEEQRAQRAYELEIRRMEEQRRHDIAIGRTVSDSRILREEHKVIELENEIAQIEKERAEAEARARRIRELEQRKAELEKRLGTLKSI